MKLVTKLTKPTYPYAKHLIISLLALFLAACGSDDDPDPTRFSVTFNANQGNPVLTTQTVEENKFATEPESPPTRAGFTFEGWYRDEAGTNKFDFENTPITANITLYAKWNAINEDDRMVTFDTNRGSDVDGAIVKQGERVTRPDDPTRDGYTFQGWFTDNGSFQDAFDFENTPIAANITLYAKWERETVNVKVYTVTFDTDEGTNIPQQEVEDGEKVAEPDDPTRNDYTFAGWFTNQEFTTSFNFGDPIRKNTTIYAKWMKNGFEIPDEKFRAYIKGRIGNAFIDGGELLDINHPDVKKLTSIEAKSLEIESLEGIEYFTAVSTLDVSANKLTNLALSAHPALTTLNVSNNTLGQLDVSGAVNLTTIDCSMNELTGLDLSDNANLETLNCSGNRLVTLDARNSQNLSSLTIHMSLDNGTAITNSGLVEISIHQSRLCNDGIKAIYFANRDGSNMEFTTYNDDGDLVESYDNITYELTCISNIPDTKFRAYLKQQLGAATFDGEFLNTRNTKVLELKTISINSIDIANLEGIQYFTGLTELTASNNKIEGEVDLSNNTALINVFIDNNKITGLDVSKNTKLKKLNCVGNRLTDLDVSNSILLEVLFCEGNLLERLNISANANEKLSLALSIHKDKDNTNPNLKEILVYTKLLCSNSREGLLVGPFNRGVKPIFNANKDRLQMTIKEYDANGNLIQTYNNTTYATKCN